MPPENNFFSHIGEVLISAALGVIGWVMATFTTKHIESMADLAKRISGLAEDVAAMKVDIGAMRKNQEGIERRVERLEDHEHGD